MSDQRYTVCIAHGPSIKTYSEQFQTQASYAPQWKAVLKKAHKQATVSCQCPGTGCRLLAVRHMSDSDSFIHAPAPNTPWIAFTTRQIPINRALARTAKAWLKKRPRVI